MTDINLAEQRVRRFVDSLFKANAARHGKNCEWPVIGGGYVSGYDPIEEMKEMAVRALLAREWFARNGPPDVPPLPLSYDERDRLKFGRRLIDYILTLFASSLNSRNYNVKEHPLFADYVSGVLWGAGRVDSKIGRLPNYPDELAELKKRYPPTMLAGIGPAFCWLPPELHAQTMARWHRSKARVAA